MAKKKYEIDINIGGRKELKETIKDVETFDKNIMASKFSSKLAKMFESASNSIKGFGKENDYMLKAMSKVVPELGVKTKKLSDITETYVLQYKKQIEQIEKLAENKYSSDIKYTEESKKIYTDYFLKQQQLHGNNLKKLIEIHEEKKKYLNDYDTRNGILKKEVEKSLKGIESDDKAAELIAELKNLSDLKKDANLHDLVIQKENIKQEEKLQTDRNKRIANLEASALEHSKRNFLGLNTIKKEESKANYEAIKQLRLQNIEDAKAESVKIADAYDEMAKGFEKGSTGEAVILEEKKNKLYAINEQILKDESVVHDSRKAYNDALVKQNAETIAKLKEHTDQLSQGMTGIQDGFKAIMNEWISDIGERITKTSAQYTEIVVKHKESQEKIESLNQEAASASGGRAIVVQEQLARQMEANQALADQEEELKKKKENLEEEKAKKEKLLKKVDLGQKLIEGIANTALAVTKALAAGPIIGQILAGIAAAAGAIQTGIIARQLSKLEDGGLLRGKRHSQGGMRIEGSNIEVEGDEFVVNRVSTRKNLGLIEYINTQRRELSPADLTTFFARNGQGSTVQQHTIKHMYEQGGQLTNLEVIDSTTAPDSNKILEAISRINFQPVVSVVDIANTQSSIAQVKDIAGA
uniref:hypothetical protein n=1 Tax=uncultured Dysgonomonas sp. TaxID=206096 RepID=UPI002617A6B3|nr:hypothetical protein [uncultured Dysgonomonas sp.]